MPDGSTFQAPTKAADAASSFPVRAWDGRGPEVHTTLEAFAAVHGLSASDVHAARLIIDAGETYRWLDAHDVDWRLYRGLPMVDAIAEHCLGWDREGRALPFTRITSGKRWDDGGQFIANVFATLPDGDVYAGHGTLYRLTLVSAPQVARKAVA